MPDMIHEIFKNKKVNMSKLIPFGFTEKDSCFIYEKILAESGFKLMVAITMDGKVNTQVIDPSTDEPYVLHLVGGVTGSFAGTIKAQYEEILNEIAEQCFEVDVFKSKQAKEVIGYVRERYADELEFLWKKFPDNAIWRRKDTGKWYGAILTVSKRKLGIKSDEMVEIIDLRINPEQLEDLLDGEAYYPGYHMNKKHWYTIILDNSVSNDELFERIDQSYILAVK